VISDSLKKFAGINGKAVLVGMYNRVEIWDEDIWEKYSSQNNRDADKLADKLSEIGIL
jgi:MraZ protein